MHWGSNGGCLIELCTPEGIQHITLGPGGKPMPKRNQGSMGRCAAVGRHSRQHEPWRRLRGAGRFLIEVGSASYSLYAKMMAYGIAFHEGDLGNWNLALNTAFCASIIYMSVSGLAMWWKRRPAGTFRLAAPPMPADMPLWKGAVLIALFLSLALPMVGLTVLAVLLFGIARVARIPALKRFMS